MKIMRTLVFSAIIIQGCSMFHRQQPPPEDVVFALDATASVVPDSFDEAMKTIEAHVNGMRRGDCITVLPIIGDADTIPSDQIVRACAPIKRQAYDSDLKSFRDQLRGRIEQERHKLAVQRSSGTDILGTIDLINQELSLDGPEAHRTVVIFSDFIEEDATRNFTYMPQMSDSLQAKKLGRELGCGRGFETGHHSNWSRIPVLLGGLQSFEIPHLAKSRRNAIRQFWLEYFEACGARPFYRSDGAGLAIITWGGAYKAKRTIGHASICFSDFFLTAAQRIY